MRRRHDILLVLLLVFILNAIGITWGIPRDEYRRFFFSEEREVSATATAVSEEYVRKSWKISKKGEDRLPRSIFNVIRSFHPDEQNIIKSISNMRPQRFDFNPHFFEYPSFLIYFTAFLVGLASVLNIVTITTDISHYFINPDAIGRFYLAGRIGVVILSVLGVLFLYKAAENFFDRKTAFFSALILAVTPLYVINSHFLTVDVPMVFWIILSLYFLSLCRQNGGMKFYYLSGLSIGFAAGTKYPALFVLFLIPTVYAVEEQEWRKMFSLSMLKTVLFVALGFFLTTPYSLFAFSEFKRDLLYQVGIRGFSRTGINIFGKIPAFIFNTHIAFQSGFCFTMCFLFLAGIISLLLRKDKGRIFIAGLLFALAPLFIAGGVRYARYYLLLSPFLSVITGIFLASVTETALFRKYRVLGVLFMSLFLGPPFLKSAAYSLHMSKEDIRIATARFIEKRIPEETEIVFTKDPWIFEVSPVNPSRYKVTIADGKDLKKIAEGGYLVIGELQDFLAYGSRKKHEKELIKRIEDNGYILEECFKRPPCILGLEFDADTTVHDMAYTHPAIYLFRKI